jgi:signal transduction histidine kinase
LDLLKAALSERDQLQQQLAEIEAGAVKERLAGIAHELRTPLNAIIGFSEMIKDAAYGPLGSGKYLEFGRDIHASGLHLLAIINDVLDLVNADTGDAKVTYSSVDPAALAREVLELTAKKAKRAGVRMVLEAGAEPAPIRTDEAKLRQILLNLTDNAIDFTPSGGTVTIALQERAKAGELVLVVSDTGVGIKREDIPKALAPFSQLDESAARKREGTGLGLPLSKKFAELLGGSLHIDSRHGMGTRVSVVLPSRSVERRRAIVRPAA